MSCSAFVVSAAFVLFLPTALLPDKATVMHACITTHHTNADHLLTCAACLQAVAVVLCTWRFTARLIQYNYNVSNWQDLWVSKQSRSGCNCANNTLTVPGTGGIPYMFCRGAEFQACVHLSSSDSKAEARTDFLATLRWRFV